MYIMNRIYKKSKLDELKHKAEIRKKSPKLRHIPNEKDVLLTLENAKLMQPLQYETLKDD